MIGVGVDLFQIAVSSSSPSSNILFSAPLINSLKLSAGVGPANFIRATSATVKEFESNTREVFSSESRFSGARRIENLLEATEDFNDPAWSYFTSGDGSVTISPDGKSVTFTVINSGRAYIDNSFQSNSNRKGVLSVSQVVNSGSIAVSNLKLGNVDVLINDDARVSVSNNFTGFQEDVWFGLGVNATASAGSITYTHPQLQDKTGASDDTVPDDYVSSGETPLGHGANVDGVEYFNTTNGNTVVNNVVIEAAGTVINNVGWLSERSATNSILWNREFSNAVYTPLNSPTLSQIEIGIDGIINTAWFVRDDSASFEYFTQVIAVPNDSNNLTSHYYIVKDTTTSRFPELRLILRNGTSQSISIQLNTRTGDTIIRGLTGTGSVIVELEHVGGIDRWRVSITLQNNSTGNVTLESFMFPAAGTIFGSTTGATTGTILLDALQIELGESFTTSPIYTEALAVTRNADVLSYPSTSVMINDGVFVFNWTPSASDQGVIGLYQCRLDNNNLIKIDHDGTNIAARITIAGVDYTAFLVLNYSAGITYRVKIRLDSVIGKDIFVDTTKGTGDANTLDLVLGSDQYIGSLDGLDQQSGAIKNFEILKGNFSDAQMLAL